MLSKVYLEITDVCNLSCSFCPGTVREKRFMSEREFLTCLDRLSGKTEYLYFHLMGEPLLHPKLADFVRLASGRGYHVCLTTNGTLIGRRREELMSVSEGIYKISISLHSMEANGAENDGYLEQCASFADEMSRRGAISVLRLWNLDGALPGENAMNPGILAYLHRRFPGEWKKTRNGYAISDAGRCYLEFGERFVWPSPAESEKDVRFCMGLRDHVGVLCDGTVVPCCLDCNGNIPLGNLFEGDLDDIISSPRAQEIYKGFTEHRAAEPLCRTCGYATRFSV